MKNSALLCILLLLSGCMNAAVTGAQAVYGRHSLKKTVNDHYTSLRAGQAIYLDTNRFRDTHVTVTTFNGVILLTGQAPSAFQRQAIERIVRKTAGTRITEFHNQITLASPSSPLTRMSDSWITARVVGGMVASEEVDPSHIKVLTENGTVYMMGTVLPPEGQAAITIARRTPGVQQVVRLFSWIHVSKRL